MPASLKSTVPLPAGRLLGLAAVALLLVLPALLGDYALHLAVSAGLMALGAMGLTILSGTAGLPSLGTAAFLAIGGFTAGIVATYLGLGLMPAMLLAALLGALVGALVAGATLRVSGLYLAVGTLALQHLVAVVATDLDLKLTFAAGFTLDAPDIFGWSVDTPLRWWAVTVVLGLAVYGLLGWLTRGAAGREWRLLREHPAAAQALGVSSTRSRLGVFALSSALIAAAGVVSAYYLGSVQAGNYTIHVAVAYLAVVALGGAGSMGGAVLASVAVILLPAALSAALRWFGADAASRVAGVENLMLGLILALSLMSRRGLLRQWLRGTKERARG
ncbi:branched-chain amino acid ABC transporter permease [Achromobacter marplatensis]|uniref:branched-chain amino acid ABC transporter permease n=1 Tax=Achromobacter marplatensis TaxID=470868 RepID=UPI0028E366BA|nr:branched-chain amino acid ABC transporter permease [Achromobacter marplatensis]